MKTVLCRFLFCSDQCVRFSLTPCLQAENCAQGNQGLRKVLEEKNTGFFGKITKGAYLVKYNDDFRLLGPKESQSDPNSKHLNVMDGGVFAIDIRKEDL